MKNEVFLVVAAVLAATSCGGAGEHGGTIELAPVTAQMAQAAIVEVPLQVELSGTVEADRVAAVSSRVMATVTAVYVQPGDAVNVGAGAGRDRPGDRQGPGGPGARGPRPGAGGARPRRAELRAIRRRWLSRRPPPSSSSTWRGCSTSRPRAPSSRRPGRRRGRLVGRARVAGRGAVRRARRCQSSWRSATSPRRAGRS